MIIKGWKKVIDKRTKSHNKYLGTGLTVKWVNKNNKIFVGNETFGRGKVHYYCKLFNENKYYYFLTEIKARKFAINYMKKHPKG